jgi:hypothetical protein
LVIRTGRKTITFGELKAMVLHAVSVSGTIKAAIKAVSRGVLNEALRELRGAGRVRRRGPRSGATVAVARLKTAK